MVGVGAGLDPGGQALKDALGRNIRVELAYDQDVILVVPLDC
jgi:hypothetical protein